MLLDAIYQSNQIVKDHFAREIVRIFIDRPPPGTSHNTSSKLVRLSPASFEG